MVTTLPPLTPEAQQRIHRVLNLRRMSVKASGPSDEWDSRVIDRVIVEMVDRGVPFSANDMRELLPEVRKCLIGARLVSAQHKGLIRWTGTVTPSTLESTKGASVKVYEPVKERP